jgi:hypothetical protein
MAPMMARRGKEASRFPKRQACDAADLKPQYEEFGSDTTKFQRRESV